MERRESGAFPPVFYPSIILTAFLALFAMAWPNWANTVTQSIQGWILAHFDWLYIVGMGIFLIICLFLMFSRLGNIKLGPDHSVPEYSNISWFAMLFAAGMGIGLMFYGVAEPLALYLSPVKGQAQTAQAAKEALNISFFHWGLHAWGVYGFLSLALAYFAYRHRLPLLPRSVLHPLLGRHIYGTIGHIIDIVAILGTLFGVATSLGIGATQVNAGLTYLFGIPNNVGMQMLFIVIIISMATVSVALGLDKGIKVLSNLNVILAIILMLFLLLAGSTVALLKDYVQNLGYYINTLVSNTFNLYAYGKSHEAWMSSWTLFYWGWWIAWSPFVAMFIARVSKGRTIRSFIFGVLFVPTGFTFLWMTVFGNSAIDLVNQGMQQLVNADAPVALYVFLSNFPLAMITSLLGVFLVVTFFVTSSDSGSLVVDMLATGNAKHSITWHRVSWSLLEGIIAIALLYAGGLAALQTAVITTALPLLFILFFMSYSLFKALKLDYMKMESLYGTARHSQFAKADSQWPQHLDAIIHYPSKEEADAFMETRAKPAMNDVANKMRERNIDVTTHIDKDDAYLKVVKKGYWNFIYQVDLRSYEMPDYEKFNSEELQNQQYYYRAEVFLVHGGQNYNIIGYGKEQIIADILSQYESHLHYLHVASND